MTASYHSSQHPGWESHHVDEDFVDVTWYNDTFYSVGTYIVLL